jgi:LuxR family maltose regulon positive regulatory protein
VIPDLSTIPHPTATAQWVDEPVWRSNVGDETNTTKQKPMVDMGRVQLSPASVSPFAGLMPTQFVAARVRPRTLSRAALVERLTAAIAPGQVTLLLAGAGWGKSTLLALWHARDPRPDRCAWFSIDPSDNELTRFWACMLAALETVDPGLSAISSGLLASPRTTVLDDAVPALVSELMGLEEPATLVLDDYDLIDNRDIEDSLRLFVEHLPPMLRLVIASRHRPALPIANLRARGQLVDFRVDGLRFTRDEAGALLRGESNIELTDDEIGILYDRTEGWVAGLHLASLSIAADPHPHEAVTGFASGDRNIGEYFRDEVLDHQAGVIRNFLQQTSVLPRLSASVCDAVTGQTNSAELLRTIEHDQLFLVPLDDERRWYRYHHLFNDVLVRDLRTANPSLVIQLHHRAAEWHRDNGDPVEAVRHALASEDRALATDLIATHSLWLCFRGEVETVLGWLHALGAERCREDVRLCLARIVVAFAGGRITEMNRWAALAEVAAQRYGMSDKVVTAFRVLITVTKWSAAYSEGDVTRSLKIAQELGRHPEVPAPWRAIARTVLGWSLYRSGQFRAAQDVLSSAGVLADEDDDALNGMISYGIQAIIAAADGLAHEAERFAAQSEVFRADNALGQHFDAWGATFARGWIVLSDQDNEHAHRYFERALESVQRGPRRLELAEVLTALSMAEESLGDVASAARHRAEAQRTLRKCPDPGYLLADPRTGPVTASVPKAAERYPGWADLTDAELLIARLVSEGLTNRAIASKLSLSRHTIDSHLKHTFTKLDIRSRVQLTRVVLANPPSLQHP